MKRVSLIVLLFLLPTGTSFAQTTSHLVVHLAAQNQFGLDALIQQQHDHRSPNFHQWLKTGEFEQRFGRTSAEKQAVGAWLTGLGCTVRKRANRFIQADCPTVPTVPANLKGIVSGVVDDKHQPKRAAQVITTCSGFHCSQIAFGPFDFYKTYDVPPLMENGRGQSVCVVVGGNINSATIATYASTFGLPVPNLQRRFDGADPGETADTAEAELDTQMVDALAPSAAIPIYLGLGTSITQLLQDAVDDNLCSVINMSWEESGEGNHAIYDPIYAQAAAQGQTVVVANGDYTDGTPNGFSTDPNVLAVGATAGLSGPNFDPPSYINQAYFFETVFFTGAVSTVYPKPLWQIGTGVPVDGSRDVPDVSLYGVSNAVLIAHDTGSSIVFTTSGATSATAPAWSGMMATIIGRVGQRIGNPDPAIYAAFNLGLNGAFHDVTVGTIGSQSAGIGYDLPTGLGTPDFAVLDHDIAQSVWEGAKCGCCCE